MKIIKKHYGVALLIVNIILGIAVAAKGQDKGYDYEYIHENRGTAREDLKVIKKGDSLYVVGDAPLLGSRYYVQTLKTSDVDDQGVIVSTYKRTFYDHPKVHGVVALADLYMEDGDFSLGFTVIYDNRMSLDVGFASWDLDLDKVFIKEWNLKHPQYDLQEFPELFPPN